MLKHLDDIDWRKLQHAYGSAEDVPALIRRLLTEQPGTGEETALQQLFGNIWHQGTVHEATSYAVPFLIEVASCNDTPDRVGVLELLAAIANGTSNEEPRLASEARNAVRSQKQALMNIMRDEIENVQLAAAYVLSQLSEDVDVIAPLLHDLLSDDNTPLYNSAILLSLGQIGDRSPESVAKLLKYAESDSEALRLAALLAIAMLKIRPISDEIRNSIVELVLTDYPGEAFEKLPCRSADDPFTEQVINFFSDRDKLAAMDKLKSALYSSGGSHNKIATLLSLAFPNVDASFRYNQSAQLSDDQREVLKAIVHAVEAAKERIFYSSFIHWGLPDDIGGVKELTEGVG